ncbi:MAG TPA: MBG domain-containing protein [Clostridia bacterium]|nr:MBG domain-containing protein [Clostridia bacterium]
MLSKKTNKNTVTIMLFTALFAVCLFSTFATSLWANTNRIAYAANTYFDISSGTGFGDGYSWNDEIESDAVLTVQDGADIEIAGTSEENKRIVVEENASASITLNNVSIALPGSASSYSPLLLNPGAIVTLILKGTNTLTARDIAAGIQVPASATLIIAGDGSLNTTGGLNGAGIGGANSGTGTITINSGIITATGGQNGAGIGGGDTGTGGSITVNSGYIVATGGSLASGIGDGANGSGGAFSLTGGVIYASSVSDKTNLSGGVLVENNILICGANDIIDMEIESPASSGTGWTYLDNVYTIQDSANILVLGESANDRRIEISTDAVASLTLCSTRIVMSNVLISPILLNDNSKLTLTIEGESTLTAGTNNAGINVPEGTELTILGGGVLHSTGGTYGAGIGGNGGWNSNISQNAGKIVINSGTIYATGSAAYAVGIGGGMHPSYLQAGASGGIIEIHGGTVTAIGGNHDGLYHLGRGIGGAARAGAGNILITGGTVCATSIGDGDEGSVDSSVIKVTGGSLIPTNQDSPTIYAPNSNSTVILGGNPTIIGRILTNTNKFSVITEETDTFAPDLFNQYTLEFCLYANDEVAVVGGAGFSSNFHLFATGQSHGYRLSDSEGNLVLNSSYTITYVTDSYGSGSIASGNKTHGVGFTLSSSTFTRDCYTQIGWAITNNGVKAYELGGTYILNEDITLYPSWQKNLITGIVVQNVDIIYDGGNHSVAITGTQPGDIVTYNTTGNYVTENPVYKNVTSETVYIGYKVTRDNHFDFANRWASVRIVPKDITVTADAKSSLHNDDLVALTYTFIPSLYEGDSFTGELATNADIDTVGEYDITQGTLAAENYNIIFAGAKYNVPSKSMVSINETAQNFSYDGTAKTFTVTGTDLSGFTVQYFVNGSYTETAPLSAGAYNVKVTRPEDTQHYALNLEITDGLVIAPKAITVTAIANSTVVGAELAALTYTLSENALIGTDTISGVLATVANKNTAGVFAITQGSLTAGSNYAITFVGANYTIKAKTLTTPEINSENPSDQDKVDAQIKNDDGFEPDITLIVKTIAFETIGTELTIPQGKEIAKTYNATLFISGNPMTPRGTMTVRFAKSADLPKADTYTIIIIENGETVQKTATVDGDYLVFTTSSLGNFAIVSNTNSSLLWLIIVLSVLVAIELAAIALFLLRHGNFNKKANSTKAYSFVGFAPIILSAIFIQAEILAVAVLGALAIGLAAVVAYFVIKLCKKNIETVTLSGQNINAEPSVKQNVETETSPKQNVTAKKLPKQNIGTENLPKQNAEEDI